MSKAIVSQKPVPSDARVVVTQTKTEQGVIYSAWQKAANQFRPEAEFYAIAGINGEVYGEVGSAVAAETDEQIKEAEAKAYKYIESVYPEVVGNSTRRCGMIITK